MTTTPAASCAGSRRIQVLWLIKGLGAGGAERLLVSLARVTDHTRFDYTVAYVLPHKDAFRPALEAAGVRVLCLSRPERSRLAWILPLRRLLRQERYDVVHMHSPLVAGVARVLARLTLRRRRPAVVSTEHNSWTSYFLPTRLANALLHPLDDHRFAVSAQARDSVWRVFRKDVEVLVHGVVLDDYQGVHERRAAERAQLGVDDGTVVVTTVANLRREKGYPELLEAARAVTRAEPDVLFVAAGQGALSHQLNVEHDRLELGDRFRFLGQVDDVPSLLAASDIFVLPSRFEGTPIAIMEAMCLALPVVATAVGGIPDQVDDGVHGLIVPPRRPDALQEALLRLIRDPELRARLAKAAEEHGRIYDIRLAARRMEEVYYSLARSRGSGLASGTG